MQEGLPVLYSFVRCPYAIRARLALAHIKQAYIHREVDLKNVSDADIYDISVIMNNTPRRCLGYRTPQEIMDEHLHKAR